MEFRGAGTVPGPELDYGQPLLFFAGGGNRNRRTHAREDAGVPLSPPLPPEYLADLFVLQYQLASTQLPPSSPVIHDEVQSLFRPFDSTGLRAAVEDQRHSDSLLSTSPSLSSSSISWSRSCPLLSEELAPRINQQKDEIELLTVHAKWETLRRTLADKQKRHYRDLLNAVDEFAARWLRDKEVEIQLARRRSVELEGLHARLRNDMMEWKERAAAAKAANDSLRTQLRHAVATADGAAQPPQKTGSKCAEDAGSAYVDADPVEPERSCRVCRLRPASVVLLPCCHLCICETCDAMAAVDRCPFCSSFRTGSIQVCQ